jgi:hypothetical protein
MGIPLTFEPGSPMTLRPESGRDPDLAMDLRRLPGIVWDTVPPQVPGRKPKRGVAIAFPDGPAVPRGPCPTIAGGTRAIGEA